MEALATRIHPLKYKNKDAAEKLIRYITRTRAYELDEKARELILWGTASGYHYHMPIHELINQFIFIQNYYNAKSYLMCHYSIRIRPETMQRINNNYYAIADYGVACCNYIYSLGFQSCFAIHHSKDKGVHIHLAINTAKFTSEHKLRQYPKEIKKTIEYPLLKLLEAYLYQPTQFSSLDIEVIP